MALDRHLAAAAPRTRPHRPAPASTFPANHPDFGSPGHRVGDRRIGSDGSKYTVALIGPSAGGSAEVETLYEWLLPVGAELPTRLPVWSGASTRGQRPVPSHRGPGLDMSRPFAELDIVASAESVTTLVVVGTGATGTDPVREHLLTCAPKQPTVTPALGPEGRFLASYDSPAEARAAVVQLRESLAAAAFTAHYDVAYDAQAGGHSWLVSIPSQPTSLGGGDAVGAAIVTQPEGGTTANEGLGDGRGGGGHGGGGPHRVQARLTPTGATKEGPAHMEMVDMNEGPCGDGEGGGDNDSGSDSGGRFGTEHPSRPEPARWPHTTSSHRPPRDRKRGADGDDASVSTGGGKRLAEGSEADDDGDQGTGPPAPPRRGFRRDNRPAWMTTSQYGGDGSSGDGGTGDPKRAPAPGATPDATEGGAAEMETEEMTEGRGDGGGGYGHSGGCPYRVPAARAPPGTTEGGAADMETAETTGDLGDSGRGGDQDGGGSGTMGDVMEDGQDGIEQPATLRGATASATLPAQRTRAAEGPGSGEGTAAEYGYATTAGRRPAAEQESDAAAAMTTTAEAAAAAAAAAGAGAGAEAAAGAAAAAAIAGEGKKKKKKKKGGKQSRMGGNAREGYRSTRDASP
jgi:hypothetical protein